MNADGGRDRKSGDACVAGIGRSPLLRLPIRSDFFGHGKNQELLLPSASDCAGSGATAKDQRRRLDEERLAGFNQSADLSTHRRKISVRTTRAIAVIGRFVASAHDNFMRGNRHGPGSCLDYEPQDTGSLDAGDHCHYRLFASAAYRPHDWTILRIVQPDLLTGGEFPALGFADLLDAIRINDECSVVIASSRWTLNV